MIIDLQDFGPFNNLDVRILFNSPEEIYGVEVLYLEGEGYTRKRSELEGWEKVLDELVYQYVVDLDEIYQQFYDEVTYGSY